MAQHLLAGITEHMLGPGIEGGDHPVQVGGNHGHLGGGIEHPTQPGVRPTQFLFANAQLMGALFH
ncbi:hypothetical protein D3C78_1937930 [compost metagenome]